MSRCYFSFRHVPLSFRNHKNISGRKLRAPESLAELQIQWFRLHRFLAVLETSAGVSSEGRRAAKRYARNGFCACGFARPIRAIGNVNETLATASFTTYELLKHMTFAAAAAAAAADAACCLLPAACCCCCCLLPACCCAAAACCRCCCCCCRCCCCLLLPAAACCGLLPKDGTRGTPDPRYP